MDNQKLTFSVSGLLWHKSLVMMDLPTKSLWSHLYGKAMSGPLKGRILKRLPSRITNWQTWRQLHPNTTVVRLKRTSHQYDDRFYRDRSQFVIGVAGDGMARAWPFDQLVHQPIVNDRVADDPILVIFLDDSSSASVYRRTVGQRVLSFVKRKGELIDFDTGSRWDRVSATAMDGPLEGTRLDPVPASVSYRWAWETFYPQSTFFDAAN